MNIIETRDLNKYYGQGPSRLQVLKNINISIEKGDFVAIIGQSGSGKSTLMNMLGCLDVPTSGQYIIDGVETGHLDSNGLARLRGEKLGFIFQRYNLLSSLSAVDNVALPSVYAGVGAEDRGQRARELLQGLELGDKLASRPNELSGGQQQRVSIARALVNGGEVILADEPTGALDSKSGVMVMETLLKLNGLGHTIIVVTHDQQVAAYANRTIELKDGVVINDIVRRPLTRERAFARPPAAALRPWHFYRAQLLEACKMSIQAIMAHKLRSCLTMLGIIIGIASVVSVVALGMGSQEKIMSDISAMGTNTITIYPGLNFGDMRSGRVKTLTVGDAQLLGRQSYLASATPISTASATIAYRNIAIRGRLNGVGEQYFDVTGLVLSRGRLFDYGDVRQNASVVVIDPNTVEQIFNGEDALGKVIIFNRQPLEVIGITEPQSQMFGGASDTLNLWSPYTTVMNKITGARSISSIIVKVTDSVSAQVAEKNITSLLTVRHQGVTDFFTVNADSIQQTVRSTTNTMTVLIAGIALISLVVGGIGVMNIMLVSVTERTREIGLRMAIGARQYNILQQFLIEAVLLCLIGGLMGILLSFVIGLVINAMLSSFSISFQPWSIILALCCSTMIGVGFGFMPARSASRLNPIEALSRE
jgi:macrolide transport system ATP-binding/permease protein